jgi:hypothetical protein
MSLLPGMLNDEFVEFTLFWVEIVLSSSQRDLGCTNERVYLQNATIGSAHVKNIARGLNISSSTSKKDAKCTTLTACSREPNFSVFPNHETGGYLQVKTLGKTSERIVKSGRSKVCEMMLF